MRKEDRIVLSSLKRFLAFAAVIALALQFALENWPVIYDAMAPLGPGRARATIFFALVYVSLVPYFCIRIARTIPLHFQPNIVGVRRALVTVTAWLFLPMVMAAPFLLLELGPTSVPKFRALYTVVTGSLIGLVVIGSVLSFGASLCLWFLLRTTPLFSSTKGLE